MIPMKVTHLLKHSLILGPLVVLACVLASTRANAQGDDLINAAENGDLSRVKALLAKGTEVNARNKNGATPLMMAAYNGHRDVVEVLLDMGADVNAKNNVGMTALIAASYQGHVEVVQALLAKGADVNAKRTDGVAAANGVTALIAASREGHLGVVQMLLSKGADVNAKTGTGVTALMMASLNGHLDVVQALFGKGADVNAKSATDITALMMASLNGHLDVVQALLDKGADINARTSDRGQTALDGATEKGHADVMALLAQAGGKRGEVNAQGKNGVGSACARIAAKGPQFGSLAKTCEFALSPRNLPNFICQEEIQRATRQRFKSKWKDGDVVTLQVAFVEGKDRYSDVAIDGNPLNFAPFTTSQEFVRQLKQLEAGPGRRQREFLGRHEGGWDFSGFGSKLTAIFYPSSQTTFTFNGEVNLPSGPSTKFDFYVHRENSPFEITVEGVSTKTGLAGSLWADQISGKLLRMEATNNEIDTSFPISTFYSNTSYGEVSISNLGSFLLPTAAEVVGCRRDGPCQRSVISFRNCRKFGAESRIIIPDEKDDH